MDRLPPHTPGGRVPTFVAAGRTFLRRIRRVLELLPPRRRRIGESAVAYCRRMDAEEIGNGWRCAICQPGDGETEPER